MSDFKNAVEPEDPEGEARSRQDRRLMMIHRQLAVAALVGGMVVALAGKPLAAAVLFLGAFVAWRTR